MVNNMKHIYFQPCTQVAPLALQSTLLAGSSTPTPVDPTIPVNPGLPTDEQW